MRETDEELGLCRSIPQVLLLFFFIGFLILKREENRRNRGREKEGRERELISCSIQVLGVLPPAMSVTQLWVTTVVGYLGLLRKNNHLIPLKYLTPHPFFYFLFFLLIGDSSQLKFHPNEHEIEAYFFLKLSVSEKIQLGGINFG